MAITWGAWENAGGNGMRVGIDYTLTAVDHNVGYCTLTVYWYTQNQAKYNNDAQGLHIGGAASDIGDIGWADASFTNNAGGSSTVQRAAHTYTYYYSDRDYGTGNAANVSISGTINGADNGVTPSCSINVDIPQRPVAPPTIDHADASYANDSTASLTVFAGSTDTRYSAPVDYVNRRRWDSASGAWTGWEGHVNGFVPAVPGAANIWQAYAGNSAGITGIVQTVTIQTTPAAPSSCSARLTSGTASIINWANGQSTNNYSYTTYVQRASSTDGGTTWSGWSTIGSVAGGTASYADSGLTPGTLYKYQVFANSTVGANLNSGTAASNSIQSEATPAAPTGLTATRNTDTSFALSWANTVSTTAPYDNVNVQRFDAASGAWVSVGTLLAGTATSLTDTATAANNEYTWRVRGENVAGVSDWVVSTTHRTTPAPVSISSVVAVSSGAMKVTWVNNTPYTATTLVLRYYKNGTLVSDTVAVPIGATTYTVTELDITASYKFGIQTKAVEGATTLLSGWTDSASTPASVPPVAPTNLAPNGIAVDDTGTIFLAWTHNPGLDGSTQSRYDIEWRVAGSSTWDNSDGESSDQGLYALSGESLVDGTTYEWHIRTYGVSVTASPWSAIATFTARKPASPSITTPSSSTLTTGQITVAWSLASDDVQSIWEVKLLDAALNVIEFETGTGSTTRSTVLTSPITNGATYTVQLRVQNQYGVWSSWKAKSLTAVLPLPAPASLSVTYGSGTGAAILTLSPTTPTGAQLPAAFVNIQRRATSLDDPDTFEDWADIATNLAPNATVIDTTPALADRTQYRAVTFAEV